MRSAKLFYALIAVIVLVHAAAASAGSAIDMENPRRAVGREDDVRVDAILVQDTISPGGAIGVTYQIHNFSPAPVAIAYRAANASYDTASRTVTLSVGAEVPQDGRMPQVVTIAPGEKKLFRGGATPALNPSVFRASSAPRYVQVKVTILRDPATFSTVTSGEPLSEQQFEQWFEANDTIVLNTIPVRFSP
ncbi:MAG TPA: hypothetical protein VF911_19185, partial [Thermoanaerobaculia bacterium]